jgi:hypothetical protein
MNRFWDGFGCGLMTMFFCSLIMVFLFFGENMPDLKVCAKKYDVFECEWVAIPKPTESPTDEQA